MVIEDLYNRHKAELERFAGSIARNEKEAQDLLQETFLRAMVHSVTLSQMADYSRRAWLYKVMKNILYDNRRRERFVIPWPEGDHMISENDFMTGVEMQDLLQRLPAMLRDIVHKRFFQSMNSKQIADELSIPHATVRYRLHTALKLLRNLLQAEKGRHHHV